MLCSGLLFNIRNIYILPVGFEVFLTLSRCMVGIFSWEVAGIPLHALCPVSIQSVSICAVCIRCTCVCTCMCAWTAKLG